MPSPRARLVLRPRLIESLNDGMRGKLTLISAPAGFGKTTLANEWAAACGRPSAWLSLDEGDNDPARFLSYLIAALRMISERISAGSPSALPSSRPQPTESVMTSLINDIAGVPDPFLLILDDYHVIESKPVRDALGFLLDHLPPRMHLAVCTRLDPDLPLARLRARGQLTELRSADLRFTPAEAAEFLNGVMGLDLSAKEVAALDGRAEGWITGLHLAAISLQGCADAGAFIASFAGGNSFVTDFLMEEVLHRQPEGIQSFLLRTSILDRLCGPLCDAVIAHPEPLGQETLERLERANLFILPLDGERRWYRYHRLFADLLRQRLDRGAAGDMAALHARASRWFEDNGMELEALVHAAAAGDAESVERLIDGEGRPLHFRSLMAPVLRAIESLPAAALDARPSLRVAYASALLLSGRPTEVEDRLRAVDAALRGAARDEKTRDLEGHAAVLRAITAVTRGETETVVRQSRLAEELLHPDNRPVRMFNSLARGLACQLQGDLAAAARTYSEVIAAGLASGIPAIAVGAASSLGQIQEAQARLPDAAETYRLMLRTVGDPAHMYNFAAHLGLARIFYEWNDLDAALQHGQQGLLLAPQIDCESPAPAEVLLARVKLARRDAAGAADLLAQAAESARRLLFEDHMPAVAAEQVRVLLRQGSISAAARLAEEHDLHACRARVHLARGNPSKALVALEPLRGQADGAGREKERLALTVLRAVAFHEKGEKQEALRLLAEALALAEPGGFVRVFVDEGAAMARLLSDALSGGIMPGFCGRLLAAFPGASGSPLQEAHPLAEALSSRELEVLGLIAQGLSNHEIADRLFVALSTVKGHNLSIFGKLQVRRRTEAVKKARELGLL